MQGGDKPVVEINGRVGEQGRERDIGIGEGLDAQTDWSGVDTV